MKPMTVLRAMVAIFTVVYSTSAQADIICRGTPAWVVVDANAFVEADFGFGPMYFCNLNSDVSNAYATLKASCPAILSQIMTAEVSGKGIGLLFPGLNSCAGIRASSGWAVEQPSQIYLFQ